MPQKDTLKQRLCLNTATIKGWDIPGQIKIAAAAGFEGIGLWLDDIQKAVKQGFPLNKISERICSAGLEVPEICFVEGWQDSEGAELEKVFSSAGGCFETAKVLGCDLVIAVPSMGEVNQDKGVRNFRRLCKIAGEYGIRIALEAVGIAREMKDIRSILKLLKEADCINGGMLFDTFHFHLAGSKPEDILDIPKDRLFLVHISDPEDVSPDLWRVKHDYRTLPFCGVLDFAPVMENLERLGYEGWFSLEAFNKRFLKERAAETAKQGIESMRRLFK